MTEKPDTNRSSGLILGGILILIGVIFLAQNVTDLNLTRWNWWALFILIPAVGSLANAWRIYQAEGATDVEFKSSRILPGLYEKSVRTAAIEIKCSDIYGLVHGSLKSPPHKSVTGFKH